MNPRTSQGRQHSANPSDRLNASVVTQPHCKRSLDGKIASDWSEASATSLSFTEQNVLLREEAFCEIQQGNYAAAIALLSVLIDRNPDSASSVNDYNNRGLLYFQTSRFAAALTDYNQALQLNPQLAKIYNNRANCYASMGRPMEALFDYETALDLNPANIHARMNQGITFCELEMYEQAIENFDLALQFDQMRCGGSTETSASIAGHIYAQRGRTSHLAGDWNYALADYRRALAILSTTDRSLLDVSHRLHLQVETWLEDLLETLIEM
ncbi:MAG: tetratricopeptide repeat protein [Stenomitos frigidus ULC029]